LLEGEKRTPHGIRIYASSLNTHMQASRDPEMWGDASRLSQYKASLSSVFYSVLSVHSAVECTTAFFVFLVSDERWIF
jgi:hypothetical protein